MITDHGEPVAEVTPRRRQQWVAAADIDALLRDLEADETWADEIGDARAAERIPNPWESAR